jgi:hypothetical protein
MIVGHAFFKIPTAISLGVVVALIAVSVIASLVSTREEGAKPVKEGHET